MPTNPGGDVDRSSVGSGNSLGERPQVKITRKHTIVYPSAEAPRCPQCESEGLRHFNFSECTPCMELLRNETTTVPQILAMLRHWNPVTQKHMHIIASEILRRGSNVNDRDGLTDMSLLHYAAKGGALAGPSVAGQTVTALLDRGADLKLRCRWTDMTALHYAVFFDVPNVVEILLKAGKRSDVEATSNDFEGGTSLHIAAANLNVESAKLLVQYGANVNATDNLGRIPNDVIPPTLDPDLVPEDAIVTLKDLLRPDSRDEILASPHTSVSGRVLLQSLGLKIGDQIMVSPNKVGTLRYCGTIHFATGVWAGVELDEPSGKNDGSLAGVSYFNCPANRGVFVPITKVSRPSQMGSDLHPSPRRDRIFSFPKLDVSHVTSKVQTEPDPVNAGLPGNREVDQPTAVKSITSDFPLLATEKNSATLKDKPCKALHKSPRLRVGRGASDPSVEPLQLVVGDRVVVGNKRKGVLRFVGETKFASGIWAGVELDSPQGKNDGSVNGMEYFKCPPAHGVFALVGRVRRILPEEEAGSDESLKDASISQSSTDGSTTSSSRKSSVSQSAQATSSFRDNGGKTERTEKPDKSEKGDKGGSTSTATAAAGDKWADKGEKQIISTMLKKSCNWLREGMNVFVQKELGILRYIGPVHFDEGTFLGVEFRQPIGKNDGTVGGTRYFRCRSGHGLLVRPCFVNIRGINGAKLFEQKEPS
ncbi:CAP-Gly domain-containing linker protein 4-like [Tropilaelaps mercedesae]|uniref:CAP-Gly domain-containing linker protein 4-like n=1 Tax=Tropilaelaps mercedesae TaxID=418985 RepID=A0A1V9XLM0_9ACAR|nr:CAP-Gly domain-containing linker protein 4-like [Tropilaelaps mercedesae]